MLCNIKKKKDVYDTIHSEMSYEELRLHSVAVRKEQVPNLPASTRELIVRTKIDVIVGEVEMFFFLDASSICTFNQGDNDNTIVPITIPLLDKYGVTPKQFITDYKNDGVILNVLDKNGLSSIEL